MISIIIPCRNRIDKLSECLDSIIIALKKADNEIQNIKSEIIVVNDHSDDGFIENINKKYSNVIVLNSVGYGPGYARNFGIEKIVYMTEREKTFSTRFSPYVHEGNIIPLFDEFERAYSDIIRNGNGKIIFTDLCIKVMQNIRP